MPRWADEKLFAAKIQQLEDELECITRDRYQLMDWTNSYLSIMDDLEQRKEAAKKEIKYAYVRYSVYNHPVDVGDGMTVQEIFSRYQNLWSIPLDVSAFKGKHRLDPNGIIRSGETIEFHRSPSYKGNLNKPQPLEPPKPKWKAPWWFNGDDETWCELGWTDPYEFEGEISFGKSKKRRIKRPPRYSGTSSTGPR